MQNSCQFIWQFVSPSTETAKFVVMGYLLNYLFQKAGLKIRNTV